MKHFGLAAFILVLSNPVLAAPDIAALAKAYGTREAATRMKLSPDGSKVLYFTSVADVGSAVKVEDIETGASQFVLAADRSQVLPTSCGWKSLDRILCRVQIIVNNQGLLLGFNRTYSVATDGSGSFELGPQATWRSEGVDQQGSRVIDWLPDDPDHVLMSVNLVPQARSRLDSTPQRTGLSVQKVDIRTNRMEQVVPANQRAASYDTDNHGSVRFMQTVAAYSNGMLRDKTELMLRRKDDDNWRAMARDTLSGVGQVDYHGFDATGDAVLMTKRLDGRAALYKMDPEGVAEPELVFAHPVVDIDGVWRIGKYLRPVAASYAVEGGELAFFDETLSKRAAALGKALGNPSSGVPPVTIIDESWDGRYNLVFAGGVTDAGRYYRFDIEGRELTELLAVRPQVANLPPAEQRPVRFPAADGVEVPGYLTLPPGRESAKGLPAIVMPHGGPAARDVLGFDWLAQFFAQAGYAVLQPNFRGSSGYGEAWYANNGFQSWETAIGDVNAGAKWLVAQGIADGARLAIFGWSYGGYAALQASVVDPGLYKAVVAVAPVTDLGLMKSMAARYTNSIVTNRFIGSGPHVEAGSPAKRAAEIAAPVLMFHGDFDQNVDIAQARAMADALKRAGKRYELVEYDKLDHSLLDDKARVDMLTRSAAWIGSAIGAGNEAGAGK